MNGEGDGGNSLRNYAEESPSVEATRFADSNGEMYASETREWREWEKVGGERGMDGERNPHGKNIAQPNKCRANRSQMEAEEAAEVDWARCTRWPS